VGFPGARLAARLETRVRRNHKWGREVVDLLSSLTLQELQAQGMLSLKRGYWIIESRLHHCLDITLREDQSRVRHPKAARVLGTIRRVVLSLANAAVNQARQQNPKTKCNTGTFQKRFRSARGGRERLHALISAKYPNVLDL
jgi:predicted transposase YbfD/YdcC